MKKITIVILIIFAAISTFSYMKLGKTELTKITVSPKWLNQAQFAGMFLAQEDGLYKDQGLEVEFKEFQFQKDTTDDLLNGSIDFAITSAEVFLTLVDQGEDVIALGAIYQQSPYVIVSLKEKNITSPADFKGKILGNKGGKLEENLFYDSLASSIGLSYKDLDIKEVGFEQKEIDDLLAGDVDAIDVYQTDQLYFFDKEGIEYNVIYPERFGINLYNDIIVGRREFVENNKELVEKFITSTMQGWKEAIENPQKAIKATMKYVTNEEYLDENYEKFILENSIPLINPNKNQPIGIMTFKKWEELYQNMKNRNLITNDIDVYNIFTNEYINHQ